MNSDKERQIIKQAFGEGNIIAFTGVQDRYKEDFTEFGNEITPLYMRLFPDAIVKMGDEIILIEAKESKAVEITQLLFNINREQMGINICYIFKCDDKTIRIVKPSQIKITETIRIGEKQLSETRTIEHWEKLLSKLGLKQSTLKLANIHKEYSGDPHFYIDDQIQNWKIIQQGRIMVPFHFSQI